MKRHQGVDRTTDAVALGDMHDGAFRTSVGNDQFRGRAEFDHAEAGGSRQTITRLQRADDAACDRTRHLSDPDGCAVVQFHHDEVRLVDLGGLFGPCVQVMSGSVAEFLHGGVAWRSIDVDIENTEKDSDDHGRSTDRFMILKVLDRRDVTVRRADQILVEHALRSSPERISEEEQQCDPDQEDQGRDPPRTDRECNRAEDGAYDRGAEPFSKSVE